MTTNPRSEKLEEFVTWAKTLKGDEKGEAQIFLDRFFRGFGWPGLKEANATCEERVKNDTGGTSFADLVWKPVVVVEMKKRGTDLSKHYRQAFDYWMRLVPNRPRYAVLCNFDEFWVYDFDTQFDTPVDIVKLATLPERYGPLNFMFPGDVAPVFGNHQETVTRKAADCLAACFNSMLKRHVERPLAQRFVLQLLMAFFAEDIGLLDKYLVIQLLEECKSPQDTYDLLGGLFVAMNTKGGNGGGRYKGVPYFNGGLFAEPARVELNAEERSLLKEAAQFDWSKVRPEIFGTLFEHSLGKTQRHAFGAHFTNPVDIMKIISPTLVEPWQQQIESASSLKELKGLLTRIENFKVLDPACGSGNFLYVAYREMKRLEASIYERMALLFPKSVDPNQRAFGFVTARNFFGIDINPFAVDIAKVTMMLAHKLSIDELHINEEALPLDNLDANFRAGDALVNADGSRATWPDVDVIVGNPPFLGAKLLKPEFGADYVNLVRKAYPEVPGMADFCVYWIRRAHDALHPCLPSDPVSGRAGLVGTQNIRNNASRIGGLDYVSLTGTIVEAVESQPWSGEANVHVSIANWIKSQDPKVVPKLRRLWFKTKSTAKKRRAPGTGSSEKIFELDVREVPLISSSLSDRVDVSAAAKLRANRGFSYTGQYPRYNEGFTLSIAEGEALRAADVKNAEVVHLFTGGDELLATGKAERYVIDFQTRPITKAQGYAKPFQIVKTLVLPYVEGLAAEERKVTQKDTGQDQTWLNSWWLHFRPRAELITKIQKMDRYLVCSRVTKRPVFMFVSSLVHPSDALSCFVLDDDYSFGVLQASPHWQWFVAKSSKMTERLRYTPQSVFDTFPWPQDPGTKNVVAVAEAGREIRRIRTEFMQTTGKGLRALYATLELPGHSPLKDAHAALDATVFAAYGFAMKKDVLAQLLVLNQSLVTLEDAGKAIQGPGIPPGYATPSKLVSNDCFGV